MAKATVTKSVVTVMLELTEDEALAVANLCGGVSHILGRTTSDNVYDALSNLGLGVKSPRYKKYDALRNAYCHDAH